MAFADRPPAWTRDPKKRGILWALAATLVLFSYAWLANAYIGILLLDAVLMVGGKVPDAIWGVIGLITLVAVPVIVVEYFARRARRRRRG